MTSETPYSGEFVPSRCPPCLQAVKYSPNVVANSTQLRASHAGFLARRDIAQSDATKLQPSPPQAYAEGLNQLAYLDVRNDSSHQQEFVIYPSNPIIQSASSADMKIRTRVFESCLKLQGDGGTMRFQLPCGPPLNWGNAKAHPGIIVIAGSRSPTEDLSFGLPGGTKSVPYGNHYKLLASGPSNGNPAQNFCVLSIPTGSEAFILSDAEMAEKNYIMPQGIQAGTIQIMTDNLDGTSKDVIAYAGIGAVNPKFPNDIVPIVTWDVGPNSMYKVTVDMRSWQVAALSNSEPGAAIESSALPPSFPVTFTPAPNHPINVSFQPGNVFKTV